MATVMALVFIELFVFVFNVLIIVRVMLSYLVRPANPFYAGVVGITEPLIGPVRKLLPMSPGLDVSPLVVFLLLEVVKYLAGKLLGG